MKKFPDFTGDVSIIGHSLGVLIVLHHLLKSHIPYTTYSIQSPGTDILRNTKYYTYYIPTTRYRILDAVGSLLSFDIFTNPLLRDQLLFKAINLFAIGSPMAAYMVLSATKREVRMWCN